MGVMPGDTIALFGMQASTTADFNLLVHVALGLVLLGGAILARRKLWHWHMRCQTAVLLLNLPLIALIMFPSFRDSVQPGVPGKLGDSFYYVAAVHATLGTIAEVLGLYIILVAGTQLIPPRFRFQKWKRWMRTELGLWWLIVAIGIGVYIVWYRPASASVAVGAHGSAFTVRVQNFSFTPRTATVRAGTTVTWVLVQSGHTVTSDTNLFNSGPLTSGQKFSWTFRKPGTYAYYCAFHGGKGGVGMAGTIVVTSR